MLLNFDFTGVVGVFQTAAAIPSIIANPRFGPIV